MAHRRKRLQARVITLKARLAEFLQREPSDQDRPMHDVAVEFLRGELTRAGYALDRLAPN